MESRLNRPSPEQVRRPEHPPSRRRLRNDRLKRMGYRLQNERRIADRERRHEEFEEVQEAGKKRTAGPKTAVEKLKAIEGIPPEVKETMDSVGELFAREMPEISSGALLSTRIKARPH